MGEWIKCSERMPPPGGMVICYSDRYRQVENMTHRFEVENDRWWSDIDGDCDGIHRECISHWQPLPSPPEDV